MIKFIVFCSFALSAAIASIYSLSVPDVNNNGIIFNNYRNKMILLVNTASTGSGTSQFAELQQLYQQNQNSLVVVAFPSNSFGHEPKSNAELKTVMQGTYGITFPIAAKSWVKGDSANIVYQWIGSKVQNDMMDGRIKRISRNF